jgi:cystathionine beta-lyase/cystathionine gamma-synthase
LTSSFPTHASIPAGTRRALGLSDTLIRLSPGCESARDLVADVIDGLVRLGASASDRGQYAIA